jgi:hypothetical protein
MNVGGLPLSWLFINAGAPLLAAARCRNRSGEQQPA